MAWTSSVGLLALCLLSGCLSAASGFVAYKRSQPLESVSQFWLTRVTKEDISGGYKIKLHFEGPQVPQIFLHRVDITPDRVEVNQNGVAEFNYSNNERPYFRLLFQHPGGYHSVAIHVDRDSPFQQIIPDVTLNVQGGSEITFREEADVDLNVLYAVDAKYDASPKLRFRMFIESTSDRPEVLRYRPDEQSPFRIVNDERSEIHASARVHINTASGHAEGILQIKATFRADCSQGCLLRGYKRYEDIAVYRQGRNMPFQEHFIGLIRFHGSTRNPSEMFCSLHEPSYCTLYCDLMGDHPSAAEIYHVQPTGKLVKRNGLSIANHRFRAFGMFVLVNATVDDAGDYQCKSRSGRVEFTHTIHVSMGYDARIDREVTRVIPSGDGSLEARCRANGVPVPTIMFKDKNGVTLVSSEDMEVSVTPLDNSTSEAVLRIMDSSVVSSLQALFCYAENTINGRLHTSLELISLGQTIRL